MNKTYVLYHANCVDGFCSAWIARTKHPDAEFIPVAYEKPVPEMDEGSEVFIVDFSYPRDILVKLAIRHARIVVIDHHKNANEQLQGLFPENVEIIFDQEMSGAGLCLKYFALEKREYYDIGLSVEDRDLWRFNYSDTKAVHSAICSYPFDFEVWDTFNVQKLTEEGICILRYRRQRIEEHKKHARDFILANYHCRGIECTVGDLVSDIAGELAETCNFGFTYHEVPKGYKYSLRSLSDFNVAEVCRKFGGNGHDQAAGFTSPNKVHFDV